MSTHSTSPGSAPSGRPVSVAHLVVGLIFTGLAALWLIAGLTDIEGPRAAIAGPAILVVAGLVGLVATFGNARNRHEDTYESTEEL